MSKADQLVERGAAQLQQLADKAAASGGMAAKLAPQLAEDAAFLRKLKPSLIAARVRGELPTDGRPDTQPAAPTGPQLQPPSKPAARSKPARQGGPNPFLVAGAALAAGVLLAKFVDWRSHAHPRD
jgi:hypothetical protein